MKSRIWQIQVDIGGTFTDCIAIAPNGYTHRLKVLSSGKLRGRIADINPDGSLQVTAPWLRQDALLQDYSFSLLQPDGQQARVASTDAGQQSITLYEADYARSLSKGTEFELGTGEEAPVVASRLITQTPANEDLPPIAMRLGTTRGTNALLEGNTDRVALLINTGLEDLLQIGTQARPRLFDLATTNKKNLYSTVIGVNARIDATGKVLNLLSEEEVNRVVAQLSKRKVKSVAIAMMHSYCNPEQEERLTAACKAAGIAYVSSSAALSPEIKILTRAETAVVDAALSTVIHPYLGKIKEKMGHGHLQVMTSAGGLNQADHYNPKDSLLSGPAAGVIGVAAIAKRLGLDQVLSLDMGGTSTDVARVAQGSPDYRFELKVGEALLQTPSVAIDTVAAGGGSICQSNGYTYSVGPESAGASPGPAAYGAGGPLTITDVNLLLGHLSKQGFSIPVNPDAATAALHTLLGERAAHQEDRDRALNSLLQIANEKMAEAIRQIAVRKGFDPADHALMAFGGAGGQHACAIADLLHIKRIIIPSNSGLLSAYGLGIAPLQRFAVRQVNQAWEAVSHQIDEILQDLQMQAIAAVQKESDNDNPISIVYSRLFLRMQGQDNSLEIDYETAAEVPRRFKERYEQIFGHWVGWQPLELEMIRVAAIQEQNAEAIAPATPAAPLESMGQQQAFIKGAWRDIPVFAGDNPSPGSTIPGPAILLNSHYTLFIDQGWNYRMHPSGHGIMQPETKLRQSISQDALSAEGKLELFTNRFRGIANDMGALLQRTAFSVNVKERLDFSCAIMDAGGELIINAPHIPVHLGSLGLCTRLVSAALPMQSGDIAITNHPAYGGSHLPDITLIAPVYVEGRLIAWVGNRAHHAELGSKRPGSMPPDASSLAEEGIVIPPMYLVKGGVSRWEEMEALLRNNPYPSRAPGENLADLRAALAAIYKGINDLQALCERHGVEEVVHYMRHIKHYAADRLALKVNMLDKALYKATEYLDDGTPLQVSIRRKANRLLIDFEGTGMQHPGNLNANEAITRSVVLYVLRLLLREEVPLTEGMLRDVDLFIPAGSILSPAFPNDPEKCPAVVGGNTETSQRLVDTLLKALQLAAASQGTMNNLLFGNAQFGYYETLGGGCGAGNGFNGAHAIHQHMTNTRLTDPEILELRYPVRLQHFAVRADSGGSGRWQGGNGLVRELEFLQPVQLTLLSQHRIEEPYGLAGGKAGSTGVQYITRVDGSREDLIGMTEAALNRGDRFSILTPGGGGYGSPAGEE